MTFLKHWSQQVNIMPSQEDEFITRFPTEIRPIEDEGASIDWARASQQLKEQFSIFKTPTQCRKR